MNFPTLYKLSSKGKLQSWQIDATAGVITTTYGFIDGKQQTSKETIREGKGLGTTAETTAEKQAELEAESRWTKQVERKGYVQDPEKAKRGDSDQAGFLSPMLAHRFDKHGSKVKWPNWAQPKLDGVRIVAVIQDGVASLWSRERKPIGAQLDHITDALEKLFPTGTHVLDGEAYSGKYKNDFEKIVSAVKSEFEVTPYTADVEYHIYDFPTVVGGYTERMKAIQELTLSGPLVPVSTIQVNNEDEAIEAFNTFIAQGFEGAMLRDPDAEYEAGKRSYSLLKIKEFVDSEYDIVGVTEGRGKMEGLAIFICKTSEGKEFNVKMKGSLESLRPFLHNEDLWRGKQLTVQYQNLTSDGLPRFPVGLRIRNDL